MMNIPHEKINLLIIGNGFDKAHGLPTGYNDFLDALNTDSNFYKYMKKEHEEKIKIFKNSLDIGLVNYLKKTKNKKGWIDFENEIKDIIFSICNFTNILTKTAGVLDKEIKYSIETINRASFSSFLFYVEENSIHYFKYASLRSLSEKDLSIFYSIVHREIESLISLFKEYIVWVNLTCTDNLEPINLFYTIHITNILTFNYTDTYQIIYNPIKREKINDDKICWVHGRVFFDGSGDIVMGSGSDYYDRKYEDFLDLFKFYQKYKYHTDTKYLHWPDCYIDNIDYSVDTKDYFDNIFIFGHSLDPTDAEILKPFLISKSNIRIYYRDEDEKFQFEKNLLAILDKDLFMEKLSGENPKIKFINFEKNM